MPIYARYPFDELRKLAEQLLYKERRLLPDFIEDGVVNLRPQIDPGNKEAHQRLEQLRKFFLACSAHEGLNLWHYGAWQNFLKKAAAQRHTSIFEFTREELATLLQEFEQTQIPKKEPSLRAREEQLIAVYQDLFRGGVRLSLSTNIEYTSDEILVLYLDLQYRQAERLADADARLHRLKALDDQWHVLIDRARGGIKAELETMAALRFMARERGRSHLVTIEHALPPEDLRGSGIGRQWKADIVLAAGGEAFAMQMKAFRRSGGATESYYDEQAERALAGLRGTSVSYTEVDPDQVSKLYQELRKRSAEGVTKPPSATLLKAEERFIVILTESLAARGRASAREFFPELFLPAPTEQKETKVKTLVTEKTMEKVVNVPLLLRYGLLANEQIRDARAIAEAKRRFIIWAVENRKKLPALEELTNPSDEQAEEIRQAFLAEPASERTEATHSRSRRR